MFASLSLLLVAQTSGFDLSYSPSPAERFELVQKSYSMQGGELIESVTFDFNLKTEKTETGYSVKIAKMLAEHIFGGEKLDLPDKNAPMENVEKRDLFGVVVDTNIDIENAQSYRLDRLTNYLPPKGFVKPGESWTHILKWPEDVGMPKIKYRFTLRSATASMARIGVEVEEFETDNPLMAKGVFAISLGEGKQKFLGGEWTTESAFMPGGSEERYRLVQTIKPGAKP